MPTSFTPAKTGGEFAADSGDLLALSTGNFATVTGLKLQIYSPQGATTGPAITLNSDGDVSSHSTVLSDGRIATAYNLNNIIYGIITNPDGTPSVPKFTIQSDSDTSWSVNNITALSGGRFALIESSYNGSVGGVDGILQVVDGQGHTTVPSFDAFFHFSGNGATINMAVLADGRLALLGHTSDNPEVAQIYSSDFNSHTTLTLAPDANYSGAFGDDNQTAVLDNGNFVHLFRPAIPNGGDRTDSTSIGLRGQVFAPDGTAVGSQFALPGEHADPNQSQFGETVVALPSGGFVVAFVGNDGPTTGNSGSPRAVELQRYNDDGTTNGSLVVTSVDRGQNVDGHPKLVVLGDGDLALTFNVGHEVGQIFTLSLHTPFSATGVAADFTGDGSIDWLQTVGGQAIVFRSLETKFASPELWATGTTPQDQAADVNGDGKADIVQYYGGREYAALSNGTGFGAFSSWSAGATATDKLIDVNGDHAADLVQYYNAREYVALSNGSNGFGAFSLWATGATAADKLVDVNGDGKADLLQYYGGREYVAISNGSSFGAFSQWATGASADDKLADVNNDGKADLLQFYGNREYVALSNGTNSFGSFKAWADGVTAADKLIDVNGDHAADLVQYYSGREYVALSNGSNSFSAFHLWATGSTADDQIIDLNHDGKADLLQTYNGHAYAALSNGDSFDAWHLWS